jgi:hypothetical protein
MLLSPLFDLAIDGKLLARDLVKVRIVDVANGDRSLFDRAVVLEVRRTHRPHGALMIVQRGEQAFRHRVDRTSSRTRVGEFLARAGRAVPRSATVSSLATSAAVTRVLARTLSNVRISAHPLAAEDDPAPMQEGLASDSVLWYTITLDKRLKSEDLNEQAIE